MKTISVTEFKAHCLELIREVNQSGEKITLTSHGKALAEVTPVVSEKRSWAPGQCAGMAQIVGDLKISLDSEEDWELD